MTRPDFVRSKLSEAEVEDLSQQLAQERELREKAEARTKELEEAARPFARLAGCDLVKSASGVLTISDGKTMAIIERSDFERLFAAISQQTADKTAEKEVKQ